MRGCIRSRITGPRSALGQRGVTLVELMVAMLLGLLLTAGAIQVFVGNRVAYTFNQGLARLQENGRFAIDTLSFRTRMAGYYGCLSEVAVTNNLAGGPGSLAFDFAEGLFGYEAKGTAPGNTFAAGDVNPANADDASDWTETLHTDLENDVIPGSDVLVIRNVSASAHSLVSPYTSSTHVFAAAATGDYAVGEIAIVSDCQKASVFQITSVAPASGGIQLGHTAAGVSPGNSATGASWGSDQAYGDAAELLRAETWIYYVGASAGGPPALYQRRLSLSGTTVSLVDDELVDGVETMQVLYGIDSDGDGAVDAYQTAGAVTDWAEVAAVRVALLIRSPEEYGTEVDQATYNVNGTIFDPVDDRRIRQVFTTTIGLRNRLP